MIVIYGRWFTAAVVIENDVVVRAAPIINYMMGWTRKRVRGYARKRHWITHET